MSEANALPLYFLYLYLTSQTKKSKKSVKKDVKALSNLAYLYSIGKMTVSGLKVEFQDYSIPVKCEKREHSVARKADKESGVKRADNLYRARKKVRQLIWANVNPHSKFLTLTTRETVLDVSVFRKRMTAFLKAMTREGYPLKYLYVLERQIQRGIKEGNEGSIHAHIIVFNDEYIPMEIIKKHWDGRTEIKMLNGLREGNSEKVKDVGAYVCKYITKEASLEWGSRCYNCSKGLVKPIEVRKTIYGDGNGDFFCESEHTENSFIRDFKAMSKITYKNAKMISYDAGNEIINQIIEYEQGHLDGTLSEQEENDKDLCLLAESDNL